MSSEKIVTLFDTTEHARAAERNLIKAGFDEDDISIIEGHHIREHEDENKGADIWKRLFGNNVEEEHGQIFSEAVRTDGAVLSLKVKEEQQAAALAILNRHQTVDISSRLPAGQPQAGGIAPVASEEITRPWLTGDESEDEILQLAREELDVGKRLVREGSTRIRRYVTEEDVSENVKLREQHAEIFRHKSDGRSVDAGDVDWSEKEVVVEEFSEKPVINKTVHIAEEVQVKKVNTEHDETVTGTVREQHIDVERRREDGKTGITPKK